METQDSNGEELDKRIDDQIEMVESESDGENFFDNSDNFTLTIRNRITNENLADLMSSYKGIQDDDERDLVVSHHVGDDLIRYFDRETQTDNHNRYNYEEEEKYWTNIQDYSMDLKIEEIGRNNESINASSILNPKKKKDSLEEYFKMTVLAMKIAHHDLDSVWHVKASILLNKANYK